MSSRVMERFAPPGFGLATGVDSASTRYPRTWVWRWTRRLALIALGNTVTQSCSMTELYFSDSAVSERMNWLPSLRGHGS